MATGFTFFFPANVLRVVDCYGSAPADLVKSEWLGVDTPLIFLKFREAKLFAPI